MSAARPDRRYGRRAVDPQGVAMPEGYRAAYQAYVEGGWGPIGGGQGLTIGPATAVLETLGAVNRGFALCPTLTVGAIEVLVHHGTSEQQAAYLPHLSSGAWTGAMNLTEPQACSDVGALKTSACRDARITPIYDIQAADLVGRQLTGDGGAALFALTSEMRHDA